MLLSTPAKDEQGVRVAEQKLTSEVVLEMSDRTGDSLEKTLRDVMALEGRLEEMDEMAERLQRVIEEELRKEELEELKEEMELEEQIAKRAVKWRTETEEEKVDELEEQIKHVFLKGLLPQGVDVTGESPLGDSVRVKLRQIGVERQEEAEGRLGPDTISVVERRTKKRVTIVDERGQREEYVEDLQVQPGVMLEKLNPEDQDVWFVIFECPPYKAVLKPAGTV